MKPPIVELEDELGDVLEKAMRRAGLTPEAVAGRAGVSFVKIRDGTPPAAERRLAMKAAVSLTSNGSRWQRSVTR